MCYNASIILRACQDSCLIIVTPLSDVLSCYVYDLHIHTALSGKYPNLAVLYAISNSAGQARYLPLISTTLFASPRQKLMLIM